MVQALRSVIVVTVLLVVAACGGGSSQPAASTVRLTVQDRTGDAQHYVVERAVARTEDDQRSVAVTIRTIDDNGINLFLEATVSGPDGTSVTCTDDDPRHYASMTHPTDTVELPCPHGLPDGSPLTAVITAG